jgi:hypothetical protein
MNPAADRPNDEALARDWERAKAQHLKRVLTPALVFDALGDRVGAEQGITARNLVFALLGYYSKAGERQLRGIVEALRSEGHPVCAHPTDGYYVARDAKDIDSTCLFLYSRAMTSLRQIAAMKRVALPDFRGQLQLPIEDKAA